MHRLIASCALLAATTPSAASAEVVDVGNDSFVTRASATAPAGTMETWLALVTPSSWWNPEHTWSGDSANLTLIPQGGGCFCERIPEGEGEGAISLEGSARHMVVVQAVPERVLRMRGGLGPLQGEPAQGVLTVTLKPVEGGTRILWEYVVGGTMRYETAEIAGAVDAMMTEQLGRLRAHLSSEGRSEGEREEDGRIDDDEEPAAADDPAEGEAAID